MAVIKILYLLVLAALAAFYVLYIDSFALILLVCALALPIILKAIMLWLRFSSAAALTCDADTCGAGESIPVTITIRNHSPLCFSQVQAVVDLQHSFGTGKERLRLRFPLQSHNVTRMTFYVHADFCGSVDVTLKKLYVLDYFHLFRANLKMRQRTTNVLILPKRIPLPIENVSEPVLHPDSDVFGDRPGDDPSEIFGLHEYAPGDAVSRIHWKLSSKADTLFVKEFSMPIQKSVLLLLEYHDSTGGAVKARIQEAELLLTLFYSVSCRMLEEQVIPTILWYDTKIGRMEQYQLQSAAQLTDVFRALYSTIHSMDMDAQILKDTATGMQFSSVTCITNHLSQNLLHVIDRQLTANQKNVLVITSNTENTAYIAEEAAVHHVHPDSVKEDIRQIVI